MEESFVYGKAVGDTNFIGREEESRRLAANFSDGINTILISPRRWGKTSLVNHVCRHLNDDNLIVVKLDIFGCKSEYDFYNQLAAAVLVQTASRRELWIEEAKDFLYRLTPKITVSPDPSSEFSISLGITPKTHSYEQVLSLPETIALRKGKHIVVCIDEFQQVGEWADSRAVQGRLRSVWQQQEHVSYCLYGSKQHLMSSIFANKSMPFYQFGDLFWLQLIPTETWVPYIVSRFREAGRNISTELATEVCQSVENYSSYVQQLARFLLLLVGKGESATEAKLKQAFFNLISVNELLFMQLVDPLSAYQMNLLKAIAAGNHDGFSERQLRENYNLGSPSNIVRLRKALIDRDLIYSLNRQLYITDPVFAQWVNMRFV